jgi:sugar/nucleoside kinase (ribokinase family)
MSEPYVVCVGLATLDTILAVPRHPMPDERVVASALVEAGGGPAATAAVTLTRLGVRAYFVGAVADDSVGRRVRADLEREGVDVSELSLVPGARSPQSTIIVDDSSATRTIVAFAGSMPDLALSDRARELCAGAAWVHVDHVGYAAAPRGVPLSIDGGNPIDRLHLDGVAVYAPTESALREQYGDARAALDAGAELVVVTRGERGSAAYGRDGTTIEAPSRPVAAVSTLGAGDVFHGALLAELVAGTPLDDALAFANACAAMSCRALDARSAIPTRAEVAA